jgi:hypothetical protein
MARSYTHLPLMYTKHRIASVLTFVYSRTVKSVLDSDVTALENTVPLPASRG